MRYNREIAVGVIAALLITFTAWAWGGVILWTQWVTAGFGLLALVVALLPSTETKWQSRALRYRVALAIAGGIGVMLFSLVRRLLEISETREATLQLIPNAELPQLAFSDWGETPVLIGLGTMLFFGLLTGLLRPSGARRRLIRFWPFWLGLFLFAWIACQSLNAWGKVIQRDLFWHIVPQHHITWLPSGLDAPFASTEEPGGMNGWRQLLIFIGPWALLCAFYISIRRTSVFTGLAMVAAINGLGVSLVGNLAFNSKWRDFLGFSATDFERIPYGPFVYKNHAGVYLYLCTGLALSAAFFYALKREHRMDRGGPHLVVGFIGIMLALGAISTYSLGAAIIALLLTVFISPLAFFLDRKLRDNLSYISLVTLIVLGSVLAYAVLSSDVGNKWRNKVISKQKSFESMGSDDRAPLRRATFEMINDGSLQRSLSGWGAGSFRWISPGYMIRQPEFLDKKGSLSYRATHAHNDWLQSIAEWGLAGWVTAGFFLFALIRLIISCFSNPASVRLLLTCTLILVALHAYFDFLTYIPQLVVLSLLVSWTFKMQLEYEDSCT